MEINKVINIQLDLKNTQRELRESKNIDVNKNNFGNAEYMVTELINETQHVIDVTI